ncbi:hypothetical protein MLC59_04705 [Marinobacter bryozoorum]|uniref:DUF6586 family protein n=1 Tax=Marinobacter bryozoorum TaxID=256324 RepID=UPI0020040C15|nr:DUF6586 family protein [Marinobacter bryozoorum]MCK7543463.1 hypothetical protein [Marinobacter bryozoorum]
MSAQWQTLVSQKLYLANQLAGLSRKQASATDREATLQGAIELALRARRLMFALVARYHQHNRAMPASVNELVELISDTPDAEILADLLRTPDSWLSHLEQLETAQSEPPRQQKAVSEENIIAVSTAAGPDRSADGLLETLAAMKAFMTDLGERHAEW